MNALDHSILTKAGLEAVLAGAELAQRLGGGLPTAHKGSLRDIVTPADLAVSDLMEARLKATGLPVISEERFRSGEVIPETFWVVDPIDGSVNFAHAIPLFAVSAGLVTRDQFPLGAVCAPALDELYFTLNPDKALFNGRPFQHEPRPLRDALVAASFAARGERAQYDMFQQVNESSRGCLRTGSAALNVCWAAVGKFQAAYGFRARLWDVAGALAIARAAGCTLAVRRHAESMTLDYCAGSEEVVAHLVGLARQHGLWERNEDGREPV